MTLSCASPVQTKTLPSSSIGSRLALISSVFEIFEIVVIEVKPSFQGSIGDTFFPLEQFDDLGENRHRRS